MAAFSGFSRETIGFLLGLTANNEKAWFDENRAVYERAWVEPAKAFVEAIGPKLKQLAPNLGYAAKLNGSLRRINRDTRFSKDKTPYKTHLDLWFWTGEVADWSPGFWFRLNCKALMLGAGMYVFEPPLLAKYRKAVVDPKMGAALEKIIAAADAKGLFVGGETYKRVPKGFAPDHPRARLLKHSALYVGTEEKIPKELTGPKFVDYCVARYRLALPVQQWLVKLTQ